MISSGEIPLIRDMVSPANTLAYLDVIRYTSGTGVSGWSLPAALSGVGLELPATVVLVGVAVVGSGLVFVLRRRPGLSWAVANVVSVIANPVLHLVAASLLVPGLAPASTDHRPEPGGGVDDEVPGHLRPDGVV